MPLNNVKFYNILETFDFQIDIFLFFAIYCAIFTNLKNFIVHIYYTKIAANNTIFIIVYEINTISLKMGWIFHTIKKHLNNHNN